MRPVGFSQSYFQPVSRFAKEEEEKNKSTRDNSARGGHQSSEPDRVNADNARRNRLQEHSDD